MCSTIKRIRMKENTKVFYLIIYGVLVLDVFNVLNVFEIPVTKFFSTISD